MDVDGGSNDLLGKFCIDQAMTLMPLVANGMPLDLLFYFQNSVNSVPPW